MTKNIVDIASRPRDAKFAAPALEPTALVAVSVLESMLLLLAEKGILDRTKAAEAFRIAAIRARDAV